MTPGYFENPQATREAIDDEGWYHSGDLGKIDADGCLYVVGRKKDVFYCSDGSNIYPSFIDFRSRMIRSCARRFWSEIESRLSPL